MKKTIRNRIGTLRISIAKRYNLLFHAGYSVRSAYGRKFLIDWQQPVDKRLAFEMFEPERITHFMNSIESMAPDMFLDIGAHAGLYSILVNSRVPKAIIHAFEPDATNLGQLNANLFLNRLSDKVVVNPFGLSDRDGSLNFASSGEQTHRAFSRVSEHGGNTVMVRRLDSVISEEGKRIAIKIDVEGHELAVLRGAEDLLRRNSCYMQMESALENFGQAKTLLEAMGYQWMGSKGDHYFTNVPDLVPPSERARGAAAKALVGKAAAL